MQTFPELSGRIKKSVDVLPASLFAARIALTGGSARIVTFGESDLLEIRPSYRGDRVRLPFVDTASVSPNLAVW